MGCDGVGEGGGLAGEGLVGEGEKGGRVIREAMFAGDWGGV